MMFSVVTPSYNQGAYIKKCIESVERQCRRVKLEHLVYDNMSTDFTRDVLQEFIDSPGYTHLSVEFEKDRGQTHAINKGFTRAQGDIVCWLNTDEFYSEDSLALVQAYFERHPDVDVVFGDVEYVDSESVALRIKRERFFSQWMLLYYGCFIPSCSTFVRRSALARAGLLDESLKVVMDFEWYLRLARQGSKFSPLGKVLASFTWHDSNISSTFVLKRKAERLEVQSRYSGLPLPVATRPVVYLFLKYFWVAVRVLGRVGAGVSSR